MGIWDDVPSLPAGHVPTDAELGVITDLLAAAPDFLYVVKAGDDTGVTNSTTFRNDPDLSLPVDTFATYEMTSGIFYSGGATGEFVGGWIGPTGATMSWCPDCLNGTVTATFAGIINRARYLITQTQTWGVSGAQIVMARPAGTLRTAGTAGHLQFRYTQAALDAVNTTLTRADSWLSLKRTA
jgi:hypothetical protein